MHKLYRRFKGNISRLCNLNNEKQWMKLYDATAKRIQKLTDIHPAMAQIIVDQLISIHKYCLNYNTFWKNGQLYRITKTYREEHDRTYKLEDNGKVIHLGKRVHV